LEQVYNFYLDPEGYDIINGYVVERASP